MQAYPAAAVCYRSSSLILRCCPELLCRTDRHLSCGPFTKWKILFKIRPSYIRRAWSSKRSPRFPSCRYVAKRPRRIRNLELCRSSWCQGCSESIADRNLSASTNYLQILLKSLYCTERVDYSGVVHCRLGFSQTSYALTISLFTSASKDRLSLRAKPVYKIAELLKALSCRWYW